LQCRLLEEAAVVRDFVRDAIDQDGVLARLVHPGAVEDDMFRDHARVTAIHFLDKRRWKRPFAPDNQANFQCHQMLL